MTERSRESELTGGYALTDQQGAAFGYDRSPCQKRPFSDSVFDSLVQVGASNLAFDQWPDLEGSSREHL